MKELLDRIWGEGATSEIVAFGHGGERTRAELLRDVAALAARLEEEHPEGKLLLMAFRDDRYAFAVTLLAAWSLQISVALPPNTRRDTITTLLLKSEVGAMAHDLDAGMGFALKALLNETSKREATPLPTRAGRSAPLWAEDAIVATLYSSGTSGATANAAPKTAAQLLGEARALGTGVFSTKPRVVATVQPAHIYGLLYSVLVPLLQDGAFLRQTPFFPETVAEAVRQHDATVLVTVPAHLRSFRGLEPDAFAGLTQVMSSTAPLPQPVAEAFSDRFGKQVTEILGSSETGGLASRLTPQEQLWNPLPNVNLAAADDGRMLVDSPFLHPDEERPYLSADLVRFEGAAFEHLGRADGVVKIAGRRISLRELEQQVLQMEGVEDAAVLALDDTGLRGTRLFLAVTGEKANTDAVLAALSATYDSSCLPRRVEHVARLPREENGKLARAQLLATFGLNAKGKAFVWELQWVEQWTGPEEQSDSLERHFLIDVPSSYRWFEGHFEGYPVMAAAIQLHDIVAPALERTLGAGYVSKVQRVKFTGRIMPGDRVELRLQGDPEKLDFSIWKQETRCSWGQVSWEVDA